MFGSKKGFDTQRHVPRYDRVLVRGVALLCKIRRRVISKGIVGSQVSSQADLF